jgi:DNA-binding FrmR family transcriptional regulator
MGKCIGENRKLINRINRIQGQVNALKSKLLDELECNKSSDPYEIIRQLSAIKGAINGMMNSYIEHYAKEHLVKEIRASSDEYNALAQIDTFLDVLKSFNK